MNEHTARLLRDVSRRFYEERASEFDHSRERPWKGWGALFDRIESSLPASPRVLDLGCGNGRFARFLAQRSDSPLRYCGVDQSELGLDHARRRLEAIDGVRLVEHDVLSSAGVVPEPLAHERFDLVVLFGVLHHVPGRERRSSLLRGACERLTPGGLLAATIWRFDRFERFRKKLVPRESWPRELTDELDAEDLEPGDHLMTWGGGPPALRYCHAMSDEEIDSLLNALPASEVARFPGDDDLNTYFVLTAEPPEDAC